MGLLTPKGEDDEEQGDVSIVGLDELDAESDDEVTFELDEWSEADRRFLQDRLDTLGAPHQWEGTTLVIAAADEAWVEGIMDQVDDDLSIDQVDADGGDAADADQVAYDLTDWDDDSCLRLLDALAADTIPYGLDDDELVVAASDEPRVDEIVTAITTPGATLTVGGPASFEAMSELFISADQLAHDPDDKDGTASLVRGARAAAGASAPYGLESGWWDGVVARAGALADLVEAPGSDHDHLVHLATALRDELRPYI